MTLVLQNLVFLVIDVTTILLTHSLAAELSSKILRDPPSFLDVSTGTGLEPLATSLDFQENDNFTSSKTSKILSGPYRPQHRPGASDPYGDLSPQGSGNIPTSQNHPSISPIDMQLLNAMEKLVARIDTMDSRVKTLESIVHYLTKKEKPEIHGPGIQRGNCPERFVQIDGIRGKCYHVSSLEKSQAVVDWKTGATECSKFGGRLAEMLNYSDYHRIATYLGKNANMRNSASTDFWTGGLNPGLIWIWSESGQEIDLDKRYWNENDNSSNSPGCLKLSYSIRLNSFFFKGAPCSQAQNFLCEVLDNSVSRGLLEFQRSLIMGQDNSSEVK